MDNKTDCNIIVWSLQTSKTVEPIFYICIIGTISHLFFWIQFIAYSSVRQRSMQWFYVYLITDLLLLIRFFVLFAYRWWSVCLPYLLHIILCYYEAIFDDYLNILQIYIILALSICRYMQVVFNHNIYSLNGRIIVMIHFFIYILPLLGYTIGIMYGWSVAEGLSNDACNLLSPVSSSFRLLYLFFSYFVPITLTFIFLLLSFNYIHKENSNRRPEIVDDQSKYHRQLITQSGVFYVLWLLLRSPHLLLFPFYSKNNDIESIAQILVYISITLDPIVIAVFDVKFLDLWRSSNDNVDRQIRRKRSTRVPVIMFSSPSDETIEHSSETT